jgi:hypothetical protein
MTTLDYLEKQYSHAFDMVKFGETKNTTLIAFNGAIIVGMTKLLEDSDELPYLRPFLFFVIAMCSISIFIGFSAMIAKIKHKERKLRADTNDNLLFYATLANMEYEKLISKIEDQYGCTSENSNHEKDLARQVIITSQIASRKFKLFNVAIAFTFSGILTPLSLLVYRLLLDHDR